jgi:hypothetical protein
VTCWWLICLRNIACSSGCKLYGFRREDSAAAIHCLAYSEGAISVGIETFGRTSYFVRCLPVCDFVVSLELPSKPVGDVALLEIEESAEEPSSTSVAIDEAIESRALSGRRCRLPSVILGRRSTLS